MKKEPSIARPDAVDFENALAWTRLKWRDEGKKGTMRELLQDAQKEHDRHQKRIAAILAESSLAVK